MVVLGVVPLMATAMLQLLLVGVLLSLLLLPTMASLPTLASLLLVVPLQLPTVGKGLLLIACKYGWLGLLAYKQPSHLYCFYCFS